MAGSKPLVMPAIPLGNPCSLPSQVPAYTECGRMECEQLSRSSSRLGLLEPIGSGPLFQYPGGR